MYTGHGLLRVCVHACSLVGGQSDFGVELYTPLKLAALLSLQKRLKGFRIEIGTRASVVDARQIPLHLTVT